ncbi:MAG TPA: translocation/assembly module TamB domain-containing protein [Polyangiaceae bacterium]|nr:translocation/assembly module TamB domain-containing protein [Polyangiaceae bacterium]
MPGPPRNQPRDLVRLAARLLCFALALMGAVPIALAAFLSSATSAKWAAEQTSLELQRELGLSAIFDVKVQLIPLRLAIENLKVPASDGGSPFLTAKSASVTPRFFALLAGKLHLGDIEIDQPDARIVLRDGKLANLEYRLPETPSKTERPKDAPFGSLSIGEGRFHVDVDGVTIATDAIDLDVFAERGGTFEVALRTGTTRVDRQHAPLLKEPDPSLPPIVEEDALCRLDLRLHYEPGSVLLRRLSMMGDADLDPKPGTRPSCDGDTENRPGLVLARLSQVRVALVDGKPPLIDGHVVARAPVPLVNRFVRASRLSGFVAFAGDVRWDGSRKLPTLQGKLTGDGIKTGDISIADKLDVDVSLQDDEVRIPRYYMRFADGDVNLVNAHIRPFAPGVPISVEKVEGKGMLFHSMMRDLNVSPQSWARWNLTTTKVTRIGGTLNPLKVDAELLAETNDFELFDKGYREPTRSHMIGVKGGITVRARLGVRPNAFEIYDGKTEFGKSALIAKLVSIGYNGEVTLDVDTLTKLELSDITPLVTIPISGRAKVDAKMSMPGGDPTLLGNIKIDDFVMGGFPVGSIESAKAKFRLLYVELSDVVAKKGTSTLRAPSARLDFATQASILVNVNAKSDAFDLRDLFAMWHFDQDPRFDDVKGKVGLDSQVRYVFGGPEDKCGGGILHSKGHVKVLGLDMFGERYDGGEGEYDFTWFDRDATIQGVDLDVPSVTLRKGSGLILGSFGLRRGAQVSGTMNGTEVPLSKLDTLPTWMRAFDGSVTASGEMSGTLDALALTSRAKISEVRLGRATFPPSDMTVRLEPVVREQKAIGTSKCGLPIYPALDRAEYDKDKAAGVFHADGELLGGQVKLNDMTITRQRKKTLGGRVQFKKVDLGAASEMMPQQALSDVRPSGTLTATVDVKRFDMEDPRTAAGTAQIEELRAEYAGYRAKIPAGASLLELGEGKLEIGALALEVSTPRGQTVTFDVTGKLDKIGQSAQVDATLGLKPLPLATLLGMLPRVERAEGMLSGKLRLQGALAAPRYQGGFELNGGEVALHGLSTPLSDIGLALSIDGSEINIVRGNAKLGSGTLALRGGAPLHGFELGAASVSITGRNLSLPSSNGIRAVADADLLATFQSSRRDGEERALPRISGSVTLKSFEYKRPVTMTADISTLTQRGKRTEFEAYDPNDDAVDLDIRILSDRPLKLQNNLVEAELQLDQRGVELSGTNARYGLRGDVSLKPGGRIKLRRSEFVIKEGRVRFDDVTRIAPRVDVTAVTEYRRYNTASQAGQGGAAAPGAAPGSGTTAAQGGRFRITMRAHGDADKLKIDLTSEPALAQDDIFLLITVGLTRAELDQAQSASVGESVALEALGTLTGADRAVTDAVPIIDELRFGSAYSSRTGRTEPTITIGKRLAERIRANVTSGVAESREIRSNVEWQLSPRVSVEGSYDNVNDISSSSLGNLGADVRWRMEFE